MKNLGQFEIKKKLAESARHAVYSARDTVGDRQVILKVLQRDAATPDNINRLHEELNIANLCDSNKVIKAYGLEVIEGRHCLILEDFGGKPIDEVPGVLELPLEQKLELAIKMCQSLDVLHQNHVIHKDVNLSNFALNDKGEVKVLDFGISSRLVNEMQDLKYSEAVEGTLAYIAPEQTGRMSRSIDYRSDYYSLGVSFYELLTGQIPFSETNELELIHSHLVKHPPAFSKLSKDLPQVLEKIVFKLMSKEPNHRYQTMEALVGDLKSCLSQLIETGSVTDFKIAQNDISPQFKLEEKLYGRESEVKALLSCFESVRKDEKMKSILVCGPSGIGKSSVVREIYKPMTEAKAYFLAGKFDQFKRNVPFSAIKDALAAFVRQVLSESNERVEQWRKLIMSQVGEDLRLLVKVLPEIHSIVNIHETADDIVIENAQIRFAMALSKFVAAISYKENPLVLFIDDLQWADNSSLDVLQSWMSDPDLKNLLLIGSFRDNEVGEAHPLQLMLDKVERQSGPLERLQIKELNKEHINHMICDSFNVDVEGARPLAALVYQKTNGNPFFVEQFLSALYDEKLLEFSKQDLHWKWDLDKIKDMRLTSNVVDLLIHKMSRLSDSVKNVLGQSAVIGHSFTLDQLAKINDISDEDLEEATFMCMREGFLVARKGGQAKVVGEGTSHGFNFIYGFPHDRVREAAYQLVPESERIQLHAMLGRELLKRYEEERDDRVLFELTDHLNYGRDVLSEDERTKLTRLNLMAGERAKSTSAFDTYHSYAKAVMDEVSEESWDRDYETTLQVYNAFAESCFLVHNCDQLEHVVDVVRRRVEKPDDAYTAISLLAGYYSSQLRYEDSVELCYRFMRDVGVKLPKKITIAHVLFNFIRNRVKMRGLSDKDLLNMPEMTDQRVLKILDLARSMSSSLLHTNPIAMPYFLLFTYSKVLDYGHNRHSGYLTAALGLILINGFAKFKEGIRFADLSFKILEKRGQVDVGANHIARFFCMHFKQPFSEVAENCMRSWNQALDIADFEFGSYQAAAALHFRFYHGDNLDDILSDTVRFAKAMDELGQDGVAIVLLNFQQLLHNLIHPVEDPQIITGKYFDAETELLRMKDQNFGPGIGGHAMYTVYSCVLFGEYESAISIMEEVKPYLESQKGMPADGLYHAYSAMVKLALMRKDRSYDKKYRSEVKKSMKVIQQWGEASTNYTAKYLLLKAELEAFHGKISKAERFYNEALAIAKQTNMICDLALIHEKYGDFLLKSNYKAASDHILQAHSFYKMWGATNKVRHLEGKFDDLFVSGSDVQKKRSVKSSTSSMMTSSYLDLQAIIHASQEISAEIEMDRLVKSIMKLLAESAGAESGCLLLTDGEGPKHAACFPDKGEAATYAHAIINYVYRMKTDVLINDGGKESAFGANDYIEENNIKSILCLPVMSSGQLKGIIYLENNQSYDAFTLDRVETLKLLASQAAISIENARLIENLSEKIRMENELKTASLVQATLLPNPVYDSQSCQVRGSYTPASECGGDWYYYNDLGDRILMCIADATGHGVSAALVTSAARSAMSVLEESLEQGVAEITAKMNKAVHACARGNVFMTFFVAILDKNTGDIEYCNASHHEPVIIPPRAEPYSWRELKMLMGEADEILGMNVDAKYSAHRSTILPGSKLVFYTDGVTELKNEKGKMLNLSKFMRTLAKGANEYQDIGDFTEHLRNDLKSFQGACELEDDVTYFVVHYQRGQSQKQAA